MCTVSINIDEARMQQINPLLSSRESISRWLQHQVELMIEEMAREMTVEKSTTTKVQDVKAESRRQALKKDMTPEQLYSLISEEIDDIYANG